MKLTTIQVAKIAARQIFKFIKQRILRLFEKKNPSSTKKPMIETCSKVSFCFLIALQGNQANCGSRTKVQQGQTIRRFCYKLFLILLVYASFDHKCD